MPHEDSMQELTKKQQYLLNVQPNINEKSALNTLFNFAFTQKQVQVVEYSPFERL